jgi:hypothetical protein
VEALVEALKQCWFTREHRPARERHREQDGSYTSTCRYCHRDLVSHDRETWSLAGEFDPTLLSQGRVLTLIDTYEDLIIRRVSVRDVANEADVDVIKKDLRARYGVDDPGSTLILRDSGNPRRRALT